MWLTVEDSVCRVIAYVQSKGVADKKAKHTVIPLKSVLCRNANANAIRPKVQYTGKSALHDY